MLEFYVKGDACKILLKLLQKEDEYIQLKSAKILIQELLKNKETVIHSEDGQAESSHTAGLRRQDAVELFRWLVLQISSSKQDVVDIGLQLLLASLSLIPFRLHFVQFR